MTGAKINFSIAAALITSQGWLPLLTDISTTAALLAPIVGLLIGLVTLVKILWNWSHGK